MATVRVSQSAMSVEDICFKYLTGLYPNDKDRAAQLSGYVERVYDLNSGLADKGQLIPIGTIIKMPEPTAEVAILQANRLWS